MRVGKENQIDRRQFPRSECASDVTLRPDGERPKAQANPVEEHGIGQDRESEEIDQNRGMSQPCDGDFLIRPGERFRMMGGGRHGPAKVAEEEAEDAQEIHVG